MTPTGSPRSTRPPVAYASSGRRSDGYARWVVAARWWIVVGWAVALVALTLVAQRVPAAEDGLGNLIPLDNPAVQAELRSVQEFGFPLSSRTVVVQRDPAGLSPFTQAESVLSAVAADQTPQQPPLLGALPLTNTVRISGRGNETNTTVITYLFMDPRSGFSSQQRAAERYIADNLRGDQFHVVGIAGSIPARAEQARLVKANLPRLELLTVVAIMVIVALVFRSVVAPVLALGASGLAFITTVQLSHLLGGLLGIAAPAELEPLLVALLLGVVTDYTIFYLSALQNRVRPDRPWSDAVRGAVAAYSPIIAVAGITVAAGTASLLAAKSEFFRGFGPAMALAVLVGLAVSVTLVPALLAILGRLAFWPRNLLAPPRQLPLLCHPRLTWMERVPLPPRGWWVQRLTRRRTAAAVLVGCVAVLLLASIPLRDIRLGVGFTDSLPRDNPVARASEASSAGFAPGINSPTTLLLEAPGITARTAELAELQAGIERVPGVVNVLGPAQNFTQRAMGIVLSRSGDAARMLVVFDHDPLGAAAVEDLRRVDERLPGLLAASGLSDVTVSVAGDTALAEGLVDSTRSDLGRIAVAAVVVNLLLLVLFLRALVAPVYLLTSSVLALTASLGLTVGFFVLGRHNDGVTFYVPFAAAVLLVALGSDYNIFGVGHVWEEAGRRPLREAIVRAIPETTYAITAAGTTLAISFGMLAVIPLRPFRELAFAMSLGIMIDVLLVRSLMVPALLTVVGRASGWPGPHLRVEPPVAVRTVVPDLRSGSSPGRDLIHTQPG